MSWQTFFGLGLCFITSLLLSLLLWRISGAPPSTFTLSSAVSSVIGLLCGVLSVTLALRAALGWPLGACFVAAIIPAWALSLALPFSVDGCLQLIETADHPQAPRARLKARWKGVEVPMPLPESPPLGCLPFEPPPGPSAELAPFWELWREEKFWACHEVLEEAWKHEADATRKQFLRGLIHGAVAVFQFRRGNWAGATRQFTRARICLRLSSSTVEGVEVKAFLAGIEREVAPAFGALSENEKASLQVLEAQLLERDAATRARPGRAPEA